MEDSNGKLVAVGYCACGCGRKTNIARRTNTRLGYIKGQPLRFVRGHNGKRPAVWTDGESKVCRKCGARQKLSNFTCAKSNRDGFDNRCKDCRRALAINYYRANSEYFADARQRQRATSGWKQYMVRAKRKDRLSHPSHHKARQAVSKALATGILIRQPCQFCGASKVEAHHQSYDKPLEVIWVCPPCHRKQFHPHKVSVMRQESVGSNA